MTELPKSILEKLFEPGDIARLEKDFACERNDTRLYITETTPLQVVECEYKGDKEYCTLKGIVSINIERDKLRKAKKWSKGEIPIKILE